MPPAVARFCAATSFAAVVGADATCFAAVNLPEPIRDFFEIAIVVLPQCVLNFLTLYILHPACQTGHDRCENPESTDLSWFNRCGVGWPSSHEFRGWVKN
jgi:hypothetical protein